MTFKTGFALAAIMTLAAAPIAAAHDNGFNHVHQSSNNGNQQLVGGALGAVVGGVLGSQLAGNGARTEGSVLGAVLGGVTGAAIAGNGSNRAGYYGGNSYYNGGYSQPYYNTGYSQPYYYGGGLNSGTSLQINVGSGGLYGGTRGFYNGGSYYGNSFNSRRRLRRNRNLRRIYSGY